MTIDGETAFDADFPVPAEQAEALLEICQGDVVEARRIADTNLEFAVAEEMRRYWSTVCACLSRHVSNDGANACDQQAASRRAPRTHEPLSE
jgi:hypothetical protein